MPVGRVFEVEAKLEVPDLEALRARLRGLGARCLGSEEQEDTFFLHPCHDLAGRDETLRLRRRRVAGTTRLELTYKGARQPADTKVREEATLALQEDPTPLLAGLGFLAGPRLAKTREDWQVGDLAVALDDLAGVGTFAEVEVIGPDASLASRQVEAGILLLGLSAAPRVEEPYIELARRKGLLG